MTIQPTAADLRAYPRLTALGLKIVRDDPESLPGVSGKAFARKLTKQQRSRNFVTRELQADFDGELFDVEIFSYAYQVGGEWCGPLVIEAREESEGEA